MMNFRGKRNLKAKSFISNFFFHFSDLILKMFLGGGEIKIFFCSLVKISWFVMKWRLEIKVFPSFLWSSFLCVISMRNKVKNDLYDKTLTSHRDLLRLVLHALSDAFGVIAKGKTKWMKPFSTFQFKNELETKLIKSMEILKYASE